MANLNKILFVGVPGGKFAVLTPDLTILQARQNFYLVKFNSKKRSKRAINSPNWLPIR